MKLQEDEFEKMFQVEEELDEKDFDFVNEEVDDESFSFFDEISTSEADLTKSGVDFSLFDNKKKESKKEDITKALERVNKEYDKYGTEDLSLVEKETTQNISKSYDENERQQSSNEGEKFNFGVDSFSGETKEIKDRRRSTDNNNTNYSSNMVGSVSDGDMGNRGSSRSSLFGPDEKISPGNYYGDEDNTIKSNLYERPAKESGLSNVTERVPVNDGPSSNQEAIDGKIKSKPVESLFNLFKNKNKEPELKNTAERKINVEQTDSFEDHDEARLTTLEFDSMFNQEPKEKVSMRVNESNGERGSKSLFNTKEDVEKKK
jgi:hypothetical protein